MIADFVITEHKLLIAALMVVIVVGVVWLLLHIPRRPR